MDTEKEVKTKVVVCYDADSELLMESLRTFAHDYPELLFEEHDIRREQGKARRLMSRFGAVSVPFCGILEGKIPVIGFYFKEGGCTENDVRDYIRTRYGAMDINDKDEPSDWKEQLKMYMERNYNTL